ncbi:hypothetical protein BSE24067_03845 [Burkholderia seminalis]|nr:hypothetical protein BSE24067_03845 [Burkholderia seminalis]
MIGASPPRDRHVRERVHQRLARERIGDDRLRQQVGGRDPEALQAARQDERLEVRRAERQQAADRVDHEPEREHALAPVRVRDRAEDQLAERIGRHVAGHARLDRLRRGRERARHVGQRGHVDVDRELAGGCEQTDQEQQEARRIRLARGSERGVHDDWEGDRAAVPHRRCSNVEQACDRGESRIVPVVAPGDRIPPGAGEVECRAALPERR